MKFLSIFGTRPEAVKLAPVLEALRSESNVSSLVCVTGQHRRLLDQVLNFFSIRPDFDLDLMRPDQGLNDLAGQALARLDALLAEVRPDRAIVHGDTTTALAAAQAAFHRGIPVAHVEAGLRTHAPASPFPEEMNRRAIALMADLHLAPTPGARANLEAERVGGRIFVTGNSGIDALDRVLGRLDAAPARPGARKLILVTSHRRESFGPPFAAICGALARLAARADVEIAFPVHPNPEIGRRAREMLGGLSNIRLLEPLGLSAFVDLLRRADLVMTDSGGVQEEAVALGKPLLVLRDVTERPEAVGLGASVLVGTDPDRIVRAAETRLDAPPGHARRSDLFGDGRAAPRIVDALMGRPVAEFASTAASVDDRVRQIG